MKKRRSPSFFITRFLFHLVWETKFLIDFEGVFLFPFLLSKTQHLKIIKVQFKFHDPQNQRVISGRTKKIKAKTFKTLFYWLGNFEKTTGKKNGIPSLGCALKQRERKGKFWWSWRKLGKKTREAKVSTRIFIWACLSLLLFLFVCIWKHKTKKTTSLFALSPEVHGRVL